MIHTTPNHWPNEVRSTLLINILKEIRKSDSRITNETLAQQLHITETTLSYLTSYRAIPLP